MAWSNFKTLSEIQNEQIVSWIFTNETKYNKKIFLSRFFYFAINFAFHKPFLVFLLGQFCVEVHIYWIIHENVEKATY